MGAKDYGRKWTADILDFVMAECPLGTGDHGQKLALLSLINTWWDKSFTPTSFTTKMCEQKIHLGIKPRQNDCGIYRGGHVTLPLWSEREKKGYVQIKTPEGWMQKNKWIWDQSHPDDRCEKYDNVIFLDGNNRNFDPANLMKVKKRELYVLHTQRRENMTADELKILVLQIRLTLRKLDILEAHGEVYNYGSGRLSKSDATERSREWRAKNREKYLETARRSRRKLKADPVRMERLRAKRREYLKKYYKEKKSEKGT